MKFSIIMPVYNSKKYLIEAIESVLEQTLDDYELVLVDNESSDESRIIVQLYAEKYDNIRAIRLEKNVEEHGACREGLKYCKGKYIYILDSDDTIDKDMLEKTYQKLEENKLDLLFVSSRTLDMVSYKASTELNVGLEDDIIYSGKKFFEEFDFNNCGPRGFWRIIAKKEYLDQEAIDLKKCCGDVCYWAEVIVQAKRIMSINKPLHTYRIHKSSVTNSKMNIIFINKHIEKIWNNYMEIIEKNFPKDLRKIQNVKMYFLVTFAPVINNISYEQILENEFQNTMNLVNKIINEFNMNFDIEIKELYYIGFVVENLYNNLKFNIKFNQVIELLEENNREIILKAIRKRKELKDKLLPIIQNCENKIGIFGTGNHTEKIMNYYNEKIKADIVFIDTYKGYNCETMMNRKIINISQINKYNFDYIVISSATYENEMYEALLNSGYDKNKIIRFYNNNKYLLF